MQVTAVVWGRILLQGSAVGAVVKKKIFNFLKIANYSPDIVDLVVHASVYTS
jgi:hypothetical protein